MKHKKMLNLLNEAGDSKFVTRKWNIVNGESKANYDVGNEIIYNTEILRSNLCDYNDAYIYVKDDVTIIVHDLDRTKNVDGTTIEDAEGLDLLILMYNLYNLME